MFYKFINLLLVQKKANEFLFIIISISETLMSRGNVFRLSGNMALGGSDYGGNDINEIKNSLKLLKAKKNQKQSIQEQYNNNYGNQISAKNSKTDYNYDATKKNSTTAIDYQKKSFGTEYRQNTGTTQTYDYSTKPPSYPQSNNNRNSRNMQSMHRPQNCQSSHNIYTEKSNTQQRNQNIQSTKAQQASQQPRRQDQFYNEREQKSIKQVNRQNQVQIGVVEYDPSQLRPCRVCDRKFNPDSIVKHEANCQKVFQKKRKEFNAQQHRLVDNQQKKLMKKGELVQKKIQAQQKNQKIPKWKAESLAFRNALKQNKNEPMDPKQAAMMKQVQNETGVKCPHCGRKFNDTAGPRHIKFCQEQARKNSMRRK